MILDMGCGTSIAYDPNVMYGNYKSEAPPPRRSKSRSRSRSRSARRLSANENNNNQEAGVKEGAGDGGATRQGEGHHSKSQRTVLVRDLIQREQSCLDREALARRKRRRQQRRASDFARTATFERESLSLTTMSRTTSRADSAMSHLLTAYREDTDDPLGEAGGKPRLEPSPEEDQEPQQLTTVENVQAETVKHKQKPRVDVTVQETDTNVVTQTRQTDAPHANGHVKSNGHAVHAAQVHVDAEL